jgi:hypothetical protein
MGAGVQVSRGRDSCVIPGQLTVVVHKPPWAFSHEIVNA